MGIYSRRPDSEGLDATIQNRRGYFEVELQGQVLQTPKGRPMQVARIEGARLLLEEVRAGEVHRDAARVTAYGLFATDVDELKSSPTASRAARREVARRLRFEAQRAGIKAVGDSVVTQVDSPWATLLGVTPAEQGTSAPSAPMPIVRAALEAWCERAPDAQIAAMRCASRAGIPAAAVVLLDHSEDSLAHSALYAADRSRDAPRRATEQTLVEALLVIARFLRAGGASAPR